MKNLLPLLFISIFALQVNAADKPVHLFILSGQSNMAGLNPKTCFLPEATRLLPDAKIEIIKIAQGGMPIRHWVAEWAELAAKKGKKAKRGVAPRFYTQILAKYRALQTTTPHLNSITFCWMQGERDAKENLSAVYADALNQLISNLRRDLKRPDMKFVIGRLSDHLMKSKEWVAVRDAQVEVARKDPLGSWVDTDAMNNLTKGGKTHDDLHYTKPGYVELGKAMARQAVTLIKGGKPADDGLPKDPTGKAGAGQAKK